MNRTCLALVLVAAVFSTGAFTAADKPADQKSGNAAAEARVLVKQLEAQADAQRAILRQTEANLKQARAVLRALEGERPDDARVTELKSHAAGLQKKIDSAMQVFRSPEDPVILELKRELAAVQQELKKLQSR